MGWLPSQGAGVHLASPKLTPEAEHHQRLELLLLQAGRQRPLELQLRPSLEPLPLLGLLLPRQRGRDGHRRPSEPTQPPQALLRRPQCRRCHRQTGPMMRCFRCCCRCLMKSRW